jgi:hypothetical protein
MALAEGGRRYQVLAVRPEVVEYLDCYPGPPSEAIRRHSSRICFEVGLTGGEIEVTPKKGGTTMSNNKGTENELQVASPEVEAAKATTAKKAKKRTTAKKAKKATTAKKAKKATTRKAKATKGAAKTSGKTVRVALGDDVKVLAAAPARQGTLREKIQILCKTAVTVGALIEKAKTIANVRGKIRAMLARGTLKRA